MGRVLPYSHCSRTSFLLLCGALANLTISCPQVRVRGMQTTAVIRLWSTCEEIPLHPHAPKPSAWCTTKQTYNMRTTNHSSALPRLLLDRAGNERRLDRGSLVVSSLSSGVCRIGIRASLHPPFQCLLLARSSSCEEWPCFRMCLHLLAVCPHVVLCTLVLTRSD